MVRLSECTTRTWSLSSPKSDQSTTSMFVDLGESILRAIEPTRCNATKIWQSYAWGGMLELSADLALCKDCVRMHRPVIEAGVVGCSLPPRRSEIHYLAVQMFSAAMVAHRYRSKI